MPYNTRKWWELMDKLSIVFEVSAPPKRYYLVEKNHNQGDNLLITEK